jgi:predicted NAD/FAD-binding protein
MKKRVAVIGAGITGVTVARLLQETCEVTLFEKNERIGGNIRTVEVEPGMFVDMGVIFFDRYRYQRFQEIAKKFNQKLAPLNSWAFYENLTPTLGLYRSIMPLGDVNVSLLKSGLGILQCIVQKNVLQAKAEETLAEYLHRNSNLIYYFEKFALPVLCGLYSLPYAILLECSANEILLAIRQYMSSIKNSPIIFKNSCENYLCSLEKDLRETNLVLNSDVNHIDRASRVIFYQLNGSISSYSFDELVFTIPPQKIIEMLASPTAEEQEHLSSFEFSPYQSVLHSDDQVLPRRKRAAAFHTFSHLKNGSISDVSHTIDARALYKLKTKNNYYVSYNPKTKIREDKIINIQKYFLPVYSNASAQSRRAIIKTNGKNSTWYCGAHFDEEFKFHEGAIRSGISVAERILALKN